MKNSLKSMLEVAPGAPAPIQEEDFDAEGGLCQITCDVTCGVSCAESCSASCAQTG